MIWTERRPRGHETPTFVAPVDLSTFFDVSLDMLVIRDLDGVVLKVSRSWETHLG